MLNNPRSVRGDDELTNLFRAALEERRGSTTHAQGKRTQKNLQSGRSGRKAYHAQQSLRAVGGFKSTMAAIHASNTIWVKNPHYALLHQQAPSVVPEYIEVPRPMCVTVDSRRGLDQDGKPYRNVGGSTAGQNYVGGRGL